MTAPVGPAGHTLPDHVKAEVVRLVRELTQVQYEAWLRAMRRMLDGTPTREAAYSMYREAGWRAQDALTAANGVLRRLPGTAA